MLSNQRIRLQDIANISGVCRQTAPIWLSNWEEQKEAGLVDQPRSGRPPIISLHQEIEIIEKHPRSLNQVLVEIAKRWNIILSKSTLKILCRKANISWKRMRKSLRKKRNDDEFAKAVEDIKILLGQADRNEINFFILVNLVLH